MATNTEFNLADIYKHAGLSSAAEVIRLRQGPCEKLSKDLKKDNALDLVRLYLGLPLPSGSDWFRETFSKEDASFSMIDNARESAALSAAILSAAFKEENVFSAFALVTASVMDHRKPKLYAELLTEAKEFLGDTSVESRTKRTFNLQSVKLPGAGKSSESITAYTQSPDWNKIGELFKLISSEARENTKTAINQLFGVVSPLVEEVNLLREQTEMLWWYVGGFSRIIGKPFSELPIGPASVMAGLDVADLSKSLPGPIAVPAILHRILEQGRKGKATKITIQNAIDDYPVDDLSKLDLKGSLKNVSDICPVLTAFNKASEIGASPAWHNAFKKAAVFSPDASFQPTQLAMQSFRERGLLMAL